MQAPVGIAMPPPIKVIPALSVWINYPVRRGEWRVSLSRQKGTTVFTQHRPAMPTPDTRFRQPNGYTLREEFLDISTEDAALAFLSRCGPFRATVHSVTFDEIVSWQRFFRERMTLGINTDALHPCYDGLEDGEDHRIAGLLSWDITVDQPSQQLHAYVHCDGVLEVIAATITLDFLDGARFAACGWCKRMFEITKNNGRQYCTQDCAHRAGQKRRRAALKQKNSDESVKSSNHPNRRGK